MKINTQTRIFGYSIISMKRQLVPAFGKLNRHPFVSHTNSITKPAQGFKVQHSNSFVLQETEYFPPNPQHSFSIINIQDKSLTIQLSLTSTIGAY